MDDVTAAPTMTNATVLTPELLNSLNPLMPDTELRDLGHGPSPDEMIIQAKGRYQGVPLTFSPDVHAGRPVRQPAGGKSGGGMNRLLLPTRSSPRKRLTLTDNEHQQRFPLAQSTPPKVDQPSSVFDTPSPEGKKTRPSPITKKIRLELEESQQDEKLTLLKGLSREQLICLASELIMDGTPGLRLALPEPDLSEMEEKLAYLKRNVFRSMGANTRLESRTDSLAFSRACIHLQAMKKEVTEQSKLLLDARQYSAGVEHAIMAWSYVRATPVWDNQPHNSLRRLMMKGVASSCSQALKKGKWSKQEAESIKER